MFYQKSKLLSGLQTSYYDMEFIELGSKMSLLGKDDEKDKVDLRPRRSRYTDEKGNVNEEDYQAALSKYHYSRHDYFRSLQIEMTKLSEGDAKKSGATESVNDIIAKYRATALQGVDIGTQWTAKKDALGAIADWHKEQATKSSDFGRERSNLNAQLDNQIYTTQLTSEASELGSKLTFLNGLIGKNFDAEILNLQAIADYEKNHTSEYNDNSGTKNKTMIYLETDVKKYFASKLSSDGGDITQKHVIKFSKNTIDKAAALDVLLEPRYEFKDNRTLKISKMFADRKSITDPANMYYIPNAAENEMMHESVLEKRVGALKVEKNSNGSFTVLEGSREGEKLTDTEVISGGFFSKLSVNNGYNVDVDNQPSPLIAVYKKYDAFEETAFKKGLSTTQQVLHDAILKPFIQDKYLRLAIVDQANSFMESIKGSFLGGLLLPIITWASKTFFGDDDKKDTATKPEPIIEVDLISQVKDIEQKRITEMLADGKFTKEEKKELMNLVKDKEGLVAEFKDAENKFTKSGASTADVDVYKEFNKQIIDGMNAPNMDKDLDLTKPLKKHEKVIEDAIRTLH